MMYLTDMMEKIRLDLLVTTKQGNVKNMHK